MDVLLHQSYTHPAKLTVKRATQPRALNLEPWRYFDKADQYYDADWGEIVSNKDGILGCRDVIPLSFSCGLLPDICLGAHTMFTYNDRALLIVLIKFDNHYPPSHSPR
jgi:hypothetical protein